MHKHEKDLSLMKKIDNFTNCPTEKWSLHENKLLLGGVGKW